MQLTLEEITDIVTSIAYKYDLKAVWLFGSYARGESRESSDIDLLIDRGEIRTSLLSPKGTINLKQQLESVLGTHVDIVTLKGMNQNKINSRFDESVIKERVLVYEQH